MDEDEQVRKIVTEFAGKIKISSELEFPNQESICTELATRKLVIFGFSEFGNLFGNEFSKRIFELGETSSSSEALKQNLERQYLFQSGEGVNVFAEKLTLMQILHEVFVDHLKRNPKVISLWTDPKNIIEEGKKLISFFNEEVKSKRLISFTAQWTCHGYLTLTRHFHILSSLLQCQSNLNLIQVLIDELKGQFEQCKTMIVHM